MRIYLAIFVVSLVALIVENIAPNASSDRRTTSVLKADSTNNSAPMDRNRSFSSAILTEHLHSDGSRATPELCAGYVCPETDVPDITTGIPHDSDISMVLIQTEENVTIFADKHYSERAMNLSADSTNTVENREAFYATTQQTDVRNTTVEDVPQQTSVDSTVGLRISHTSGELTDTPNDSASRVTSSPTVQSTLPTTDDGRSSSNTTEFAIIFNSVENRSESGERQIPTNIQPSVQADGDVLTATLQTVIDQYERKDHLSTETVLKHRGTCYRRPNVKACNAAHASARTNHVALKWYFDPMEMSCFFTSDCINREEAFDTQTDCERTCLPQQGLSRCLAPPKAGFFQCNTKENPSTTPILAVYFDKTTGKCRWFTYYGCGGTGNRFRSISECEGACGNKAAADILSVATILCQASPTDLPTDDDSVLDSLSKEGQHLVRNLSYSRALLAEPGCTNYGQFESRWYMDKATKTCEEFPYSHCGGSPNNFLTRTDCEWFCGANRPTSEDICHLPASTGDCTDFRQAWYFDSGHLQPSSDGTFIQSGSCRTFNFSGCGGNSNRFQTENECSQMCATFTQSVATAPPIETVGSTVGQEITQVPTPAVLGLTTESSKILDFSVTAISTAQPVRKSVTLQNIDLEPCRKPPITGYCRPLNCTQEVCQPHRLLRWFFDAHTSHCEPFNYSGCGGSVNTFDDAHSCQVACKARIFRRDRDRRCDSLPHHTKCYTLSFSGSSDLTSNSYPIVFHFNIESATCKAFHLNTNRTECSRKSYFANGQDCLRECMKSTPMEKHLQNRCFARKTHAISNCTESQREQISRWSYLAELKQCVRFSQCLSHSDSGEQPGNNFASKAECETTCNPNGFEDVCQLPKDTGPCSRTDVRYFYDAKSEQCKVFLYGGCLGNANRFISHEECELACSAFPSRVLGNPGHERQNDSVIPPNTEPPPIAAETFERMQRVTQHHMDHFPWDQCLESHTYGTCPRSLGYGASSRIFKHTPLTRFYYDRHAGHCQTFTYTGCGSRANHFDTIEYCKQACEDRLKNPKSKRCDTENVQHHLCVGSGIQAWWFNKSIGDCQSIELCLSASGHPRDQASGWPGPAATFRLRHARQWLGVWQSMKGRYPTGMYASRSACQFHCLPKPVKGTDVQNICHMNPIVTVPFGCNAMVTRWYFEPREGTCHSYVTCPQYGNNFQSEETCRDVCSPVHPLQICRLPKDHGGCSQFVTRWYYDPMSRSCKSFLYGGCFGNSNKFLSKSECESFCTMQDVCRLPLQKHSTDNSYPKRFHFNQTSRRCEAFHFTGILPHGNNFPSMDACNATCLGGAQIDVIADVFIAVDSDGSDWSVHSVDGSTVNRHVVAKPLHRINTAPEFNITGTFNSPCFTPQPGFSNATMLEKQSLCDPDDIINELGYRFYAAASPTDDPASSNTEGFCELTLVPVCLSEPKQVFRTVFDPSMRILGRVFQTMVECERTCMQNRRRKRSATDHLPQMMQFRKASLDKMLMHQFEKLLVTSGFDSDKSVSGDIPNGCRPDQPIAEQIDRFQHTFQVHTRWPCKMDTKAAGDLVPLVEALEGTTEVWLPCWVISEQRPKVKWTHLKSGRSFMVQSTPIPILQDVWMGHLHLRHMQVFRHNGAWLCEAHKENDKESILTAIIQLHVLANPFAGQKPHFSSHSFSSGAISKPLRIPEGGTLLLLCPTNHTAKNSGYFVDSTVRWQFTRKSVENRPEPQNPKVLTTSVFQPLYIHPVKSTLHAGIWSCGADTFRTALPGAPRPFHFTVEVDRAPRFVNARSPVHRHPVSKHQRVKHLTCASVDPGSPMATLKWIRCSQGHGKQCWPVRHEDSYHSNGLLVHPVFGDTYVCRYENTWGRVEQLHMFT